VYTLADAAVATIGETKYYSFDAAFEAAQSGDTIVLVDNAEATTDMTYVLEKGKTLNLELGGYTLYAENTRTETHNFLIDVKGGVLNVKNGTIQYKHTGNNMEWNGACTIIDITAGGVVNMEGVTVENLGGTDMNFSVHLNNWGEVTLTADDCEFLSTYCGVRVFNSGYDMNNVTITNSKLTGSTRAFWVHNYIGDLNSAQHSDEAIKARLNLDIYNNGNTFEVRGEPVSPIRYGFGETVYFNEAGKIVGFSGYDEVGDGLYKKETKYRVTNANGLALINSMMIETDKDKKPAPAGKGITVELWDNIDFTGKTWTPVDSHVDTAFTINEFNGNNYTISNLTINGQAMFKRFANNSDVTFKNVTFDNATVNNSSINTAIIVGHTYNNLLLENVDVKDSSITGGYKVATLVGTVYNESSSSVTATLKDCDVTNTTVK
ncbi:MAG: hypothetical protein UHY58_01565, partial [Alistipes sp.]|nr:hypothetical protein [Alistipes sp.]